MSKLFFFLFWGLTVKTLSAFNIATDSAGAKILNISENSSYNRSSLAGYQFFASSIAGSLSLVAGAPKYKSGEGRVLQCSVDNIVSTPETDCSIAYDSNSFIPGKYQRITEVDAFGLTVIQTSETNSYLACAPGRLKYCGRSIQQMPGACYSNNIEPNENYGDLELVSWDEVVCFTTFLDLVFLVDSSKSINSTDFDEIKNVLINVSDVFQDSIGGSTQLGVVLYGEGEENLMVETPFTSEFYRIPTNLGECSDVSCFKMKIENEMTHALFDNTYTAQAIKNVVLNVFSNSSNAEKSNKVLVLITDGVASDSSNLQNSFELTEENNVTVYAIGVGSKVNLNQLYTSANGNTGTDRVLKLDNYNQLSRELTELAKIISNVQSEGQSSGVATSSYENALMGFSAHYQPKTNDVFIGAVGAFEGTGSVVKMVNGSIGYLPEFSQLQIALPGKSLDSYLGYVISSGYYDGNDILLVAAGAPRHELYGAVLIYQPTNFSNLSDPQLIKATNCLTCESNNKQVGSYFGGSLLSTDINGDGKDDLLVGAPLWVGDNYDEGRVYVYLSQASNSVQTWTTTTYQPIILTGDRSEGGRFGMAISSAGDINNDGYNDVIISAPSADNNKGVIFFYHGGVDGTMTNFAQKISASTLGSTLQYFGLSVQGNIDVDSNNIPDLLVSSAFTDAIVVLRSRPVVDFSGSLSFSPTDVNIIECFNSNDFDCLIVKACLTPTGKSIENTLVVKFNISVDPVLKRIQFQRHGNSSLNQIKSGFVKLTKNRETCWNYTLYVRPNNLIDYDSNITGVMLFELYHEKDSDLLTSITNINAKTQFTSISKFNRSCANHECLPNLQISANVLLPNLTITTTTLENNISKTVETDLSANKTILVISSETIHQPLLFKVNLTNDGENSFGTEVSILFSAQLNYLKVSSVSSSNSLFPNCIRDDRNDIINGSMNTKHLVYQYNTNFGSIMPQNTWCYFEVEFSATRLRKSGTLNSLYFGVTSSSMTSTNTEADVSNWEYNIPVIYRSDLEVKRKGIDVVTYFNFTDINLEADSVFKIGENVPTINIEYEIKGLGFSNIPNIEFNLNYPSKLNLNTQRLLYLYNVQCISIEGGATCKCDKNNVNTLKLSTTAINPTRPIINVYANQNPITRNIFDCSELDQPFFCETLRCEINNLGSSDVIQFRSLFRLWSQALRFQNQTSVVLRSGLSVSTLQSPLIYNKDGLNSTLFTSRVDVTAKLYEPPVIIPTVNALFIFIYASTGGILFLLAIIATMYKAGFFGRSKYAILRIEAAEEANRVESDVDIVVGTINMKRISAMEL